MVGAAPCRSFCSGRVRRRLDVYWPGGKHDVSCTRAAALWEAFLFSPLLSVFTVGVPKTRGITRLPSLFLFYSCRFGSPTHDGEVRGRKRDRGNQEIAAVQRSYRIVYYICLEAVKTKNAKYCFLGCDNRTVFALASRSSVTCGVAFALNIRLYIRLINKWQSCLRLLLSVSRWPRSRRVPLCRVCTDLSAP